MLLPFKELFQRHNVQSKGVLHCGASSGQEARAYHENGVEQVIWIEAIPLVYEHLKRNMVQYPKDVCLNYCISDVDGQEVTFHIANNGGQSSSLLQFGVHATLHPAVKFIDSLRLQTIRIDTIFKEWKPACEIDFLNLDLQGAELQALKGMGELLHQFKYLYLEVNKQEAYIGGALVGEVDEYVAGFGFERVETARWVGDTWTDAFYVKKKQWKHMAPPPVSGLGPQ